ASLRARPAPAQIPRDQRAQREGVGPEIDLLEHHARPADLGVARRAEIVAVVVELVEHEQLSEAPERPALQTADRLEQAAPDRHLPVRDAEPERIALGLAAEAQVPQELHITLRWNGGVAGREVLSLEGGSQLLDALDHRVQGLAAREPVLRGIG